MECDCERSVQLGRWNSRLYIKAQQADVKSFAGFLELSEARSNSSKEVWVRCLSCGTAEIKLSFRDGVKFPNVKIHIYRCQPLRLLGDLKEAIADAAKTSAGSKRARNSERDAAIAAAGTAAGDVDEDDVAPAAPSGTQLSLSALQTPLRRL